MNYIDNVLKLNSAYEISGEDIKNIVLNIEDLQENIIDINIRNKDYKCIKLKENYHYIKFFKNDFKENIIDKNSSYFLINMMPYIHFPENFIYINGFPTFKELYDMLNIKKTLFYEIINNLIVNDILRKVKKGNNIILFFNTFLISCGYTLYETYELFKDSKYNSYANLKLKNNSFTYFIQNSITKEIKIGKSKNITNRLKSLQTNSPHTLELLGYIEDDIEIELHRKFKKYNVKNEWFLPDDEIINYININCKLSK